MISSIHQRPQSKRFQTRKSSTVIARPITRQQDQQQSEKCFQMAKQHQEKNNLSKAKEFYLQAIIHDSYNFKALCNLGSCFRSQQNYHAAITAYEKAIKIKSDDAISNYNLANIYRIIGDEEKAIELYKKVNQSSTLFANSRVNLGICYQNMGRYDEAIKCYDEAANHGGNNQDESILFNKAMCIKKIVQKLVLNRKNCDKVIVDQVEKAEGLFKKVLELNSKSQMSELSLIELVHLKDESSEAVLNSCVQKYTKICENAESSNYIKEQASRLKGYCLSVLKKYDDAARSYKQALAKQDAERAAAEKLRLENEKKQKEQAEKELKKNTYDTDVSKKSEVGRKQQQQEQSSSVKAAQPSKSADQIQNERKKIMQERFYEILNKYVQEITKDQSSQQEKFTSAIENATKQKDLNESYQNQIKIILCSIQSERSSDREAAQLAQDIYVRCFLKPNSHNKSSSAEDFITKDMFAIETHRAIASILTSVGENEKAIKHYQIISENYKETQTTEKSSLFELHSGLGTNYQLQGMHSQAVEEFRKSLQLDPSNHILYFNLGYCLQCLEKFDEAIKQYQNFIAKVNETNKNELSETKTIQQYIVQAEINIMSCLLDPKDLVKKADEISVKLKELYPEGVTQSLRYFEHQVILGFYLKAADAYEVKIKTLASKERPAIEEANQTSVEEDIKQYKEKLIAVYLSLLEIPDVPDREEILINCGNIFYEEGEYISALKFYQSLDRKEMILNNIALTYFNLHEWSLAMVHMQQAIELQGQENAIYRVNMGILQWVFGVVENQDEKERQINLLAKKYPCRSEVQFHSRVQFGKNLFEKLTRIIARRFEGGNKQISDTQVQLNFDELFEKLLEKEQQAADLQTSVFAKKNMFFHQYFSRYCSNSTQKSNSQIQQGRVSDKKLEQVMRFAFKKGQSQKQDIERTFQDLIKMLNKALYAQSSSSSNVPATNYCTFISTALSLFILSKFKSVTPEQIKRGRETLSQRIQSSNFNQSVTFKDQYTDLEEQWREKGFTIKYPELELKVKNVTNSIMGWESNMEDQIGYIFRILESIAYHEDQTSQKCLISKPIKIDFAFSHSNDFDVNQSNFLKVAYMIKQFFGIQFDKEFSQSASEGADLNSVKNDIISSYLQYVPKQLSQKLVGEKDDKQLRVALNEKMVPSEFTLSFATQENRVKFLKLLQQSFQLASLEKGEKLTRNECLCLTVNKIVKIKCLVENSENPGSENRVNSILLDHLRSIQQCPLGLSHWALLNLDSDCDDLWKGNSEVEKLVKEHQQIGWVFNKKVEKSSD